MRLSEAFVWKGRIMLPGGKVLSNDDVEILRRRYPANSFLVGDPVLDSVVEFEDDSKEREVAYVATKKIAACMSDVQERLASRTNPASIDFESVRRSAIEILDYLKTNPVSATMLTRNFDPGCYLSEHAGNVFYMSIVLGSVVRDYVVKERTRQTAASDLSATVALNLLPLGLGTMFMDVGMYPLAHLFQRPGALSPEERAAVLEHPTKGAELMPDSLPAGVRLVVRAHHENFDGTGYPHGVKGESLHIFPRIARICDAYDAATAVRTFRQAKSPARAIWEICLGPYKRFYDPVLAKVFMSLIQPFPIGAKIKLVDGRSAVVVRYNRKTPYQPMIIVAFDPAGQRLEKDKLQGPLAAGSTPDTRLASFGGESLAYLYDETPPAVPQHDVKKLETIFDAAYP